MSAVDLKNAGNALFKEGHFAAAWDKYDEAAKLDSSTPIYLANRAQCELKLEQYGSAIETCTEALAIDGSFVKCFYRRAIAYGSILKYAESVRDFRRVVSLAPDFGEGRAKLLAAQSLARYTSFQQAIKVEDEPSVFEQLDLESMPVDDGPSTIVEDGFDLDNLNISAVKRLVEHFKNDKRLPKRTVYDIVKRVAALLAEEPSMTEIAPPAAGKITVCGDTHGQFYDVLQIFEKNGWPSSTHSYLFNGDFVDRGSWSTEVALLLYVLKLAYPQNLWLNRGNHETDLMNVAYGFSGECKAKYKTEKVFRAFSESFSNLPLACLIGESYLVLHGGLFSLPGVTLADIRKLDRFATKQPGNDGLMMEMLWSDPQENNGLAASKRGIAHMFGPDVTAEFVKENHLKAVIRSHEVRDNGFEVEHGGKLITVFSAPNYCDQVGNKGAYINIEPDLELHYEQFEAVWHPSVPPMAYASGLMR